MKLLAVILLPIFFKYSPILAPVTSFPLELPINSSDSVDLTDEGRLDNVEERGSDFQGDILGMDADSFPSKSGAIDEDLRWPRNTVVYYISNDFTSSQKDLIRNATLTISNSTCIKMQELKSRPLGLLTDYVFVVKVASGCSSYVGRIGSMQKLNLGVNCLRAGTVAHEFIHAIGFHHEHSRSDRDDYISILYANILKKKVSQFKKFESDVVDHFNLSYDYGSIMHYSQYAFSRDGISKTLEPKFNYTGRIGQRVDLSDSDIRKINNMYCIGVDVDANVPGLGILLSIASSVLFWFSYLS